VTRRRLRIGAGAVAGLSVSGLLALWFESTQHTLILIGSLDAWMLSVIVGAIATIAATTVAFSVAYQLSSWRGRLGTILGVVVVVAASAGVLYVGAWMFIVLVFDSSNVYARMPATHDGDEVVVGVSSWFHSSFEVFRGNGILFDTAPIQPSVVTRYPVNVARWVVDQSNGHYFIEYSTSSKGPLKKLIDLG
jgi:hypothetical protein